MASFDFQSLGSGIGDIAGFGLGVYGSLGAAGASKQEAQISKQIAGLEIQADQQRKTAMEISARRMQTESVRNAQRARSMALQNATTQGAQFGSGLQGGYGSIEGQSAFNQLGVSQNLQIGENLFGINQQIDVQKMAMADAKSTESTDMAIGGLGKGLGSVVGDVFKIGGLFAGL